MDIKLTVVAMLEAVTDLLRAGFAPERTLLFAFGHDEEVGGRLGAEFDGDPARWRMIAEAVSTAGAGCVCGVM